MKTTYWRKTDNSGMLYPLIITLSSQSIFRFSAMLSQAVQPEILKNAFNAALCRFPAFKTELYCGLFRASFVENYREPVVHHNDGTTMGKINIQKNNGYFIRVSYYERNIYLDFFHGLSDGTGASVFFRYLLCTYAIELGADIDLSATFPVHSGEEEDGYQKYYDKNANTKGMLSSANKNAAQVKGTYLKHEGLGIISGKCPLDSALAVSHNLDCSVTVLLAAVALLSAIESGECTKQNDPTMFLPVNLRRFFPSDTLLNFVCSVKCIIPRSIPTDTAQYIKEISQQLSDSLNKQALQREIRMASTVARNPIVRFMPLFIKRALIILGRSFSTKTKQTMILSNMGALSLPENAMPFVTDVGFNLNCNRRTPVNCAVITYGGKIKISFSRHIREHNLESCFFARLRQLGIDCDISSNYREAHDAL